MRTVASEVETPEVGGTLRAKARAVAARKSRLRRMALEDLEARTLLSTLPAATTGTPINIDTGGVGGNASSPQIAIDRYNPNKLVAVWTQYNPNVAGTQKAFIQGAYSNDGGQLWTRFNAAPPTMGDPDTTNPVQPFAQVTDPSVGFDANNQVYVLVDEHETDPNNNAGPAAGAIILEKYDFSGSAPQAVPFINLYSGNQQSFNVLYEWANGVDTVARPTMAVDDNQATFQDPDSKQTQTDGPISTAPAGTPSYSGHVYVAWATNTNAPTNPGTFNPNTIRMLISSDQGQTFTTQTILNGNGYFGNEHDGSPQVAISQGRLADPATFGPADTGVPGGQVTTVWDDFGSLNGANQDEIWSSRILNSGTADDFAGTPGVITKAFAGVNGSPDFPQTTLFTDDVNITDPSFTTLSDMSVTLNINEPSSNTELSAVLIAPDGAQITLFTNQQNSAGQTINGNIGVTGNGLGIATSGAQVGTLFDDIAARNISDRNATSPYIGTFRPEFSSLMAAFGTVVDATTGLSRPATAADLSGSWTLQIVDNRADGTNAPPTLGNWSLNFTSGATDQPDIPVARTPVRGNFDANFGLGVPSTPNGVGPAPVIASDNSLGSFSPNEGTLYVSYVTHDNSVNSNPSSNTDIALYTSTDGGQSWQLSSFKVNDDNALTDGFSGALTLSDPLNNTARESGATQYMPAITVDQSTGTMVLSWRDARNDGANARLATYVTTSIDGGQTFSPDDFVNAPEEVTDAITGKQIVEGPMPDNESGGNSATDATFGYGTKMGIVAFDGHVYAAWSGNFNAQTPNGPVPLTVYVNPVLIAAGPRILTSTMGPVGGPNDTLNTQTAPDGTPIPTTIAVTFDRPIDPTGVKTKTFLPSDVEVFFNGTATGALPISLDVTSVKPVPTAGDPDNDGRFGYTQWLITFDPSKLANGTPRAGTIDYTGTYSYLIEPEISDEIRSFQVTPVVEPVIVQAAVAPNVPQPIPSAGTGGSFTASDTIDSFITLSGHPNQVITAVTVNLSLTHTRDGDLDILLTAPNGNQVTLYYNPFDTGQNFTNTTFAAGAPSILTGTAPYTGTFSPDDAETTTSEGLVLPTTLLASLNGGVVDGFWDLTITDNVAGNIGQLNNWSLTVNSQAPSATPSLQNGNMMDQNADAVTAEDPTKAPDPTHPNYGPFTGLTPGDVYAAPAPLPPLPVTYNLAPGSATPFPPGPYSLDSLPLIVAGPHVVTTAVPSPGAVAGATDNLVLNSTVSALNLTFDRDMVSSSFTPADILQIMGPAGRIDGPQTFNLPSASQNQAITSAAPLLSTITIPNDNNTFPVSSLSVQVNITDATDSNLTGYLIAPNGNKLLLFSNVGNGLNGANFTGTTFSDSATTSIVNGTAPFTGTFKPQGGTLTALIRPNGAGNPPLDLEGNWQLQIIDGGAKNIGTLNSWSLIATPQLSVTPKGDGKTTGTSRTFTVGFPQQQLSGTYTVEIAPTIMSASGDTVDSNLNAGVDILRGQGVNNPTTPIIYSASNLPQRIPGAVTVGGLTNPGTLVSTINVPDNFPIQGIINGLSGLTVQLNITDPSDSDLQATLVYHPGLPDQVSIPLFSNVGSGPSAANFQNTVFDDQSTTPIQSGGAPFFGTYAPQEPLLSPSIAGPGLTGLSSAGAWELVIKDTKATPKNSTPTLNSWSLTFQRPLPTSGLGEPNIDNISESFRIFTMDPSNPLSSDTWTAVGPAGVTDFGGQPGATTTEAGGLPLTNGGQIGAIAVDPSDPSGNTVFIGGASGGVWKTTNFLDPNSPTWIPLTDFGSTFSLNIGSIAVFPRNNNPNQSIVIASTGNGDSGSQGVGFLRSMDGGATWTLLDSTTNADASGNVLPIASPLRNHTFVGDTSYKVVVDPKLGVTGGVIIYAALSGPTGGIYRSQDTGNTWQLMLPGEATDVTLDLNSGTGGNGNLQIVYAGMASGGSTAAGVYLSPNQGQVWNLMTGTTGNPLIVDLTTGRNVNPQTAPNPNDPAATRIVLAKPALTGIPNQDKTYAGWLYAATIGAGGGLDGLYETKDFGQNWTKVSIPNNVLGQLGAFTQADPSRDVNLKNYDVTNGTRGQYNISLAVDPANPAVVYLGGSEVGNPIPQSTGLIRIDTTLVWDAHNADTRSPILNDGGATNFGAPAPLVMDNQNNQNFTGLESQANDFNAPFPPNNFINLIRDPAQPFLSNATLDLVNAASFTNNGAGVTWIPFDIGGSDVHRMVTEIDPLTGLTRLIVGDDQGIFTVVDKNGTMQTNVGNAVLPSGTRNGNLQIQQFFYGAAQPSNLAAEAAQALFYGSSNQNGGPASDPNVLANGNITWTATNPVGEPFDSLGIDLGAAGVATNQQGGTSATVGGTATQYQYWWPGGGGGFTDFFEATFNGNFPISRTFGLLQSSNGLPTPDPQWPLLGGSIFTVNPINGQQIIISATGNNNGIGRIFSTENGGETWQVIGQPTALDNSYAPALAYGAPDPTAPAGIGNFDNFVYAGTTAGHIFMTQTGGGANGNQWTNISNGLDLSTVEQITTNPTRGSHEAFAVTQQGVYHISDSVALANDLAANAKAPAGNQPFTAAQIAALGWQPITGNLFGIMFNTLGSSGLSATLLKQVAGQVNQPNRGAEDADIVLEQLGGLTSIVADWRYAIPANPAKPASATNPTHPVLYVAGGAGVYRSLDNGATWQIFPSQSTDNAPQDGGLLPNTQVTALTLDLGNIDVNTGRAIQKPGDPNVLLATTYGRGDFAIHVGPAITPTSVLLDTTNPAPAGSNAGVAPNGGPLVTVDNPVFDGFSEQSAFGNTVHITLFDLTNPNNPVYIGGYDGTAGDNADVTTDAFGHFAVQVIAGDLKTNGVKTIGIQATDSSGTKGNIVPFSFTLQTANLGQPTPPTPPTLVLTPADDSSHGQNITNVTQPHLTGVTSANVQVALLDASGNVVPLVNPLNPSGPSVLFVTSDQSGNFTLQPFTPLNGNPPTLYKFRAQASNANGTTFSPFVSFTVETVGPKTNVFQGLAPADDTGIVGDNITTNRRPHFIGTTDPNAEVDLLNFATGAVLASTNADGSGHYSIQLPQDLTDGTITLQTRVHDVAGNQGPLSPPVTVTIASVLDDYNADSETELALFQRTGTNQATFFINKGVTPAAGITFPPATVSQANPVVAAGPVIPFTGDFNGDGINDLAVFSPNGTITYNPINPTNPITNSQPTWIIQNSGGGSLLGGNVQTIPIGQTGDIPVTGNFDGNGLTEVGVFEPATGTWIIAGANGVKTYQFGQSGDIPVAGNYDGKGFDELALYRPSLGQYLIDGPNSTSTTGPNGVTQVITNPETVTVGVANEIPAPAGYDNSFYFQNGVAQRTEPAVYDPNSGKLTVFKFSVPITFTGQALNGVTYTEQFNPGDIIAPGDYDGTGNAEPAAYRPSNGTFYIDNQSTGIQESQQFGPAGGGIPVLAPYFYRQLANVVTTPTIGLNPLDDSSHGLSITNVTQPRIIGKADAGAQISLINTNTGAVLGTSFADLNGNYSVVPSNPLTDGTYPLQVKSSGLNNTSKLSPILNVTIDTKLQVTSVSPPDHSFNVGLPNHQVVVTFNHPIAGLTPDDPTGNGFATNPYAVFLAPQGPEGFFSAPSGIDAGDVPLHGTLVYHVNGDGTSQITFTPTVPLGTDIYLISIGGLTDLAGNALLNNSGQPGPYFTTLEIKPTPADTTPVRVTAVTANNGATVINNNMIPQPDTIGIAFNKTMDDLTINNNTVQLFAETTNGNILLKSNVAYSPTTQTAYLTPETLLSPGVVYLVAVNGSVSDDLNFPGTGDTLGTSFFTTFQVGSVAATGSGPLRVVATNPANQALVTQPIGYVSAQFTEQVNLSSLGRYSAMVIPNPGPPNNFLPLNDSLSFNPNTNQLIIVPTVPLGNASYIVSLGKMNATNGDPLLNASNQASGVNGPPVFSSFGLAATSLNATSISKASVSGHEFVESAVTPSSNTTVTAATTPTTSQGTTSSAPKAPTPTVRVRPAQAARKAHDEALELAIHDAHSLLSARRRALTSGVDHAAGAHKHRGAKS